LAETLGPLLIPLAVSGFLIRRHLKSRKAAATSAKSQPSVAKAGKPQTSKPRRDYKVKRHMSPEEAEARAQQLREQRRLAAGGDPESGDEEGEEGEGGEAGEEGSAAEQENFFKMLQS
jgi:hypothetical protein